MNLQDAYNSIVTGAERYRRGKMADVEFAVWVTPEYDISVMHITDRRSMIYNRDLKAKGRRVYKEYVGTYNFLISLGDFASDVQYVVDLLNTPKEPVKINTTRRQINEYLH